MKTDSKVSLAGAAVVVGARAHETERYAAGELARYLYLLTGRISRITAALPAKGAAVVLDAKLAAALGVKPEPEKLGDQGYRLAAVSKGGRRFVAVAAAAPAGVLYGVYGLLEELGMGFYAGGDTFPELPADAALPAGFDRTDVPVFKVRGNMLHYNFLCGPTTWGLDDYKFYFDQLSRMRCNMLLMHWYDGEPGAAYDIDGEYLAGGVTPNSLTKPWGALASLRTSQFSFGTGRCFDAEIFSSPCGEDMPDLLTEVKRSEEMFSEATRYARRAGVGVAAGFEIPRQDPADSGAEARFKARVRQFLLRNPHLTHFALWQHESGGCVGSEAPARGTAAAGLMERRRKYFFHVGNEQRVWEAVRCGRFAEFALEVLEELRPGMPMVFVGWGGDRWMQFADYCVGYDKFLPSNVIFTCHDNIDASMGPNVSSPWGMLPPERERWAMPWVEGDIEACDVRQPHVESLGLLAPDALKKGCQGLLTLQWRTRDVEEETGYIARFAWDSSLTPNSFYRRLARHSFGPDQEEAMGRHIETLQKLGARWAGVRGTAECSRMRWTGAVPHYPFECDAKAVEYLVPMAKKAAEALAEVPQSKDSEAAFHLIQDAGGKAESRYDYERLGVKELQNAVAALEKLASAESPEPCLRRALRTIEEDVYAIRPLLVAFGMTSRSYMSLDSFLIAIHHIWRNAGAESRRRTLQGIRRSLESLRRKYLKDKRLQRLERLDYLAETIGFALDFNAAVMLLADGELVETALAAAGAAKKDGDHAKAAKLAADAYAALIPAGMQGALHAFARKLTTRCDFGTLCTLNVKPLPLYWETVGRLEEFMPAAPPREISAVGRKAEVWLSWNPGLRAAAQNLYRRNAGGAGAWKKVNRAPLSGSCQMFCDRTVKPGAYEYAVTSVAADGWESPRSHAAAACAGSAAEAPRIIACKPYSCVRAGAALNMNVVAMSDRGIASVALCWRQNGAKDWNHVPMTRRFRDSWGASIADGQILEGMLEFYVEAADCEGRRAWWPLQGASLPWSATVVP